MINSFNSVSQMKKRLLYPELSQERTNSHFTSLKRLSLSPSVLYCIAAVCFTALTCYWFWLAGRGFGNSDEAFFYSIPHRFLLGDRPLVDEWHISQFSGFLQYIPFKIYYSFFGTEGIILFFRRLYVVLQLIVSVFMFWRMRDHGVCALISSILFFTHTIMGYCVLNYYVLSLLPVTCIAMLLFFGKELRWYGYAIVGFLAAAAVLAEPILALVYFGYAFAVLFCLIKRSKKTGGLLAPKHFFLITSGIAAIAIVVIAFMLSRASVSEYVSAIPDILTDPEHEFSIAKILNRIVGIPYYLMNTVSFWLVLIYVVLFFVVLFDKKRISHRVVYAFLSGVLSVVMLSVIAVRYFAGEKPLFLMRHCPLFFFGAFCWLLLENKKEHKRLLCLYWFGLLFSFLITLSSDGSPYITFLMGGVFANSAVIVLVRELYREIKNGYAAAPSQDPMPDFFYVIKKVVPVSLAAVVMVPFIVEIVDLPLKKDYLYVENRLFPDVSVSDKEYDPAELPDPSYTVAIIPEKTSIFSRIRFVGSNSSEPIDTEMTSGPLKGIYTTSEYANDYQLILNDLDEMKNSGDGSVYVFAAVPMCYLYLDHPYSAYSAYLLVHGDNESRQSRYWELHPDRFPSCIYIPEVTFPKSKLIDMSSYVDIVKENFDCEITKTPIGFICRIK